MFELSVRSRFRATHAITIAGVHETPHEHDWRVIVTVACDTLDGDGLLCDFHDLEKSLEAILAPFHDSDLNATPPFDALNPTAEHVAKHIGDAMKKGLPANVELRAVAVTEAPGCEAVFRA